MKKLHFLVTLKIFLKDDNNWKKSGLNDPVLNQLAKLYKEKFPEKKLPNIQIVKDMIKRHKEGESLENIINNHISK